MSEQNNNILVRLSNHKDWIVMINDFNFGLLGFYFYYYTTQTDYITIYNIGINYLYLYYSVDSIIEIYNKRFLMIPHHLCAIYMLSLFEYFQYYTLKNIFYYMSLIEISGGLTNIRTILKSNKLLNIYFDIPLLCIYSYIRQICFLNHIINDYNLNNIHEKQFYYISIFVYLMSFYWTFQWTQSIIKYNKLLKNE